MKQNQYRSTHTKQRTKPNKLTKVSSPGHNSLTFIVLFAFYKCLSIDHQPEVDTDFSGGHYHTSFNQLHTKIILALIKKKPDNNLTITLF